ncbi:MAG: glycosyltransferase family 2 protein [Novosphingobium pentaromativorans]|uniref:Glycosyltransferase family 2 protein n=1 Tax=Novosphingobium pentaromativorans TaxID=205844 RepID=A0A2W5QIS4_9SPHN|nr:MAG: glycosyltransferase family 2 protein [Novosphingobium pentaromativorans]
MPQVSVIMPCYNASAFLDRAIGSLRDQTFQDWELLAIDDCSTDDTAERLREWSQRDPRVRNLRTARNGGPSVARNIGIGEARGEWLAILDADDAFKPERLAVLTALAEERAADFVFDGLIYYDDQEGKETGQSFQHTGISPVSISELIHAERPGSPLKFGFLKPMMRRAFIMDNALRYSERLRFAEDFDLYARCLLSGARGILDRRGFYVYTTQLGQVSGARSQGTRTRFTPQTRVEIMDSLIADYGETIDSSTMETLLQGRRWQVLYADAHRLGELRRTGQWPAFASLAARHPHALWRFISRSRLFRSSGGGNNSAAGI